MAKQWFIVKDGTQYGPMAPEELKRKAASGELQPDDRVRPDDRENWFKASAVKGLFTSTADEKPPQCNGAEATPGGEATDGKQEGHLVRNVAIAASVATALIVGVILVPFAMRDTWELYNAERVSARLEEADRLQESDPPKALEIYDEILAEAKQHKLTNELLSKKIAVAEKSQGALYQKVQEKIRVDEAERKRLADEETKRYYRDSRGAILSETAIEEDLEEIRNKIQSMPDNGERAYMKGVLRAAEEEWARMKRKGPVEQPSAVDGSGKEAPLGKSPLSESERRQIFFELVKAQDAGVGIRESYTLIARKYGLPEIMLSDIAYEGAAKKWPTP
jgi:hypothetical protein